MKKPLNRLLLSVLLICGLIATPEGAHASAGYMPTYPGEFLNVEFCMDPGAGPRLYILGTKDGKRFRTFQAFKPRFVGKDSFCGAGQFLYEYEWEVNARGTWTLFFYSPTLKKRYWGWPDGIESK